MDYVDGNLLVDPQKMMNDTFKACGGLSGFLIGSYIDRHYLNYEIPVSEKASNLPMLTCIGAAIMFPALLWTGKTLYGWMCSSSGKHYEDYNADCKNRLCYNHRYNG